MSTTTNYDLYLTSDSSEAFQSWREKINGETDSNMIKIDTAIGTKADSSVDMSATLLASAWEQSDESYVQELSISGLTASQNGVISISPDATIDERDTARAAALSVTGQRAGALIISADGDVPTSDIPVHIILLG